MGLVEFYLNLLLSYHNEVWKNLYIVHVDSTLSSNFLQLETLTWPYDVRNFSQIFCFKENVYVCLVGISATLSVQCMCKCIYKYYTLYPFFKEDAKQYYIMRFVFYVFVFS